METGRIEKFEWLDGGGSYLIARGELELPGGVLSVEWAQGEKEDSRFEIRIGLVRGYERGWGVDGQSIEFSNFWIKSGDGAESVDKKDFISSRFDVGPVCKGGEDVLERTKTELYG